MMATTTVTWSSPEGGRPSCTCSNRVMSPKWAQWQEEWVELDSDGTSRQPRVDHEWDTSSQKAHRGFETFAFVKIKNKYI